MKYHRTRRGNIKADIPGSVILPFFSSEPTHVYTKKQKKLSGKST